MTRLALPQPGFRATLALERIGDGPGAAPWVALLVWDEWHGVRRVFLRPQVDYRDANSVGTRGVWYRYVLIDGIYEVSERRAWRQTRRYFLRVAGGTRREMSREEVDRCLSSAASA